MQTLLTQYSTVLLLVGIAFGLLALRRAIRQFNQSRRAPYYILREEAARSAGRWTIAAVLTVALTAALAVFASQSPPEPASEPTPTATRLVPTLGPAPTRTATSTSSPSPMPSPTPTLTPTSPPAVDVPDILLTPIPNAVAPNPEARFEFLTLASRIDDDLNPIDPGLQFPVGASRVYAFFRASGVNDGAPWGLFCYRDGDIFDLFVGLWDDGPAAQTSRAFCAHDGDPGQYTLRVYLGTTLAFEAQYALAGAPPTPSP
jgi:hypothetical protein